MKMRLLIGLFLVFFVVGGGWWWMQRDGGGYKGEVSRVRVSLKWLHQAQFAGHYVADQEGYYAKEGIEVELVPFDYEHFPIDEVVAGRSEYGVAGADEILIARSQGKPVVAVAAIFQETPVVAYTLASSGIETVDEIRGKTVGVEKSENVRLIVDALLAANGIELGRDTREVEIGFDATALLDGTVDVATGYATNEPLQAEAAGEKVVVFSPADYGVQAYADVLFVTEEKLAEDRDEVGRFVRATLKGWEEAIRDPELAVSSVLMYEDANNEALTYDLQMKQMVAEIPLVKPTSGIEVGTMNYTKWNKMNEMLVRYGLVESGLDVTEAYTTEIIEKI